MSQRPRYPLATRVKAAAVMLLIEAVFLAILGAFFVWLPSPDWRPWEAEMGARLPAKASLSVAEGRVVAVESHTTRRRRYVRPKVEFTVEGQSYQVHTVFSYSPGLQPYETPQQPARVLYTPGKPQEAWLEWEYDRFITSMDSTPTKMAALLGRAKAGYWRLALWILGLSVAVFVIILLVPQFR
jgi:hypothetical protein